MHRRSPLAACLASLCVGLAVPALGCGPEVLERATVARIGPVGDVYLANGRVIRLAGMSAIGPDLLPLRPGDRLAFGELGEQDRWGRVPAIVFALPTDGDPVFLQSWLVETGRALIRHEPGLGPCWDVLKKADATASRHPVTPEEAGRYARIEGRVLRIGEGRSARFITVRAPDGRTTTGMISGRNLARLGRAGVDLKTLPGHIVRLWGVRSLRNPRIIAVTRAEQIEIVR